MPTQYLLHGSDTGFAGHSYFFLLQLSGTKRFKLIAPGPLHGLTAYPSVMRALVDCSAAAPALANAFALPLAVAGSATSAAQSLIRERSNSRVEREGDAHRSRE